MTAQHRPPRPWMNPPPPPPPVYRCPFCGHVVGVQRCANCGAAKGEKP